MASDRMGMTIGPQRSLWALILVGLLVLAGCGGGGSSGGGGGGGSASSSCTVGDYSGNVGKGTDTATLDGTTYTEGENGANTGNPPNGDDPVAMCNPIMEAGVGTNDIQAFVYFDYDDSSFTKALHIQVPDDVAGTYTQALTGFYINYSPSASVECFFSVGVGPDDGLATIVIDDFDPAPAVISGTATVTQWESGNDPECTDGMVFTFSIAQTLITP